MEAMTRILAITAATLALMLGLGAVASATVSPHATAVTERCK